ncbi:MAG: metal ABC transporter ATP-binding protein [archaeon]|nr:metal ABC transporter ATP-binding protein [archaeon]
MEEDKTPVLEVRNVNVARSNALVIEDANFTIQWGDYVGIVGPNGGGKTTLLLAILGIIPRQRGDIRLFGEDIDSFSHWERVAYVPQGAIKFDPHFPITARELVALGRVNQGNIGRKLKREDWEAVDEALDFMGISDIANKRIGQLSGGQKQRVFVAKALVRKPEIIFLDEPVTGVDASTQEKFYKKLSNLNTEKDITILIVSHDLTAVFCRMSKVMCVNREVNISEITDDLEPNEVLRKAYGEHFHFVFHKHKCEVVFEND